MNLREALRKLKEMDDNLLPARASRHELVGPSDDLNKKLLAKIEIIADGLADAFAEEGIDLDAKLIADDIRRDCGLMGGIVSTDELDPEGNPFDAATKQMHDMGPVDVNRACQMLLDVPPHEFVAVFMNGLKRNRGLLPGGDRRALPNRMPRRIGEAKGKDYSYIDELVNKYASEIKECKVKEDLHEDEGDWRELKTVQEVKDFAKDSKWVFANEDSDSYFDEYTRHGDVFVCRGEGENRQLGLKKPDGTIHHVYDVNDCKVEGFKEELLDEDLKGYFKNKYINMFLPQGFEQMDPRMQKKAEDEAYKQAFEIAKLDPTFKGKDEQKAEDGLKKDKGQYFDWLMRLLKKGKMTYEVMMQNAESFKDQLFHFEDYKNRKKIPADRRDIMKYQSLEEIAELINSLGGDIDVSQASTSEFKEAIKNIRGALQAICGFRDNEIPEEIKSTSDCLTFVCENDRWEVWQIENIWGAMIADTYGIDWGGGATWCTGGQYGRGDRPRKGRELLESAQQHYPHYAGGDNKLVFFQQKDNTIPRPKNKAQVTVKGGYNVQSFFHANDSSIGLNNDGTISYTGGGWGHDTSEVMTVFITQEGLLEPLKNSILRGIEPIADAENLARLEAGGNYVYTGGKIKDSFKQAIHNIEFVDDQGNKQVIDVSANDKKSFLQCESIEEMSNMLRLSKGEAYIFDGQKIKDIFRPMIKKAVFSEGYNEVMRTRDARTGEVLEVVGIPRMAFKDCSNMTELNMPVEVLYIGPSAFKGCDKVKIITPRYPDRPLTYQPGDVDFLKEHLYYDDGTLAFGGSSSGEGE